MNVQPIYTADNVKPTYQLMYSLAVFWNTSPGTESWLAELTQLTETDGIRILECRFRDVTTSHFLVSTLPDVSPQKIPARIKGRLQHLLKNDLRQPFRRNYDLVSIGSTKGEKIDAYLAGQIEHHSNDVPNVLREFTDLQFVDPEVNLRRPRFTNHGRCTCNLHVVIVHKDRRKVRDHALLLRIRKMIRSWSEKHDVLLSRAAILTDHLHLTIGLSPGSVPMDVALSLMNNVAWVHGMEPILQPSFFLGTFGNYDLGALRD